MNHAARFLADAGSICQRIAHETIERLAAGLAELRDRGGRLFLLGVGGSAGNCSHAVNDFRKLCGIEAYSPIDNVSELTARTNDEGWDTVFAACVQTSRINSNDAVLIFSVGGGDAERNVSPNLVKAIDAAKKHSAKVFGIVGKDTGYTANRATSWSSSHKRIPPGSRRFRKLSRRWFGTALSHIRCCRRTPLNGKGCVPRS